MAITRDEALRIIEQLYTTKSLKQALGNDATKSRYFYEFLAQNPDIDRLYGRAQQARAEILADEIIEIADTEDDANRARVRVDSRKWYASKMQPHKYGDRLDLNITETVSVAAALSEARKRMTIDLGPQSQLQSQIVDETNQPGSSDAEKSRDVGKPDDIFD